MAAFVGATLAILAFPFAPSAAAESMPLLPAMRKLRGIAGPEEGLKTGWSPIKAYWIDGGAEDIGEARNPGPGMERAADFEAALRDRIGLIARFEAKERTALEMLHGASLLAIAVLFGVGLQALENADRSRRDRERLREIIRAAFAGQEAERSRISLELHDSIAQDVASLLMTARRLPETPEGDRGKLVAKGKKRRGPFEPRPRS